jgi:hypothetical protein
VEIEVVVPAQLWHNGFGQIQNHTGRLPPMPAYHKKTVHSIEKSDLQLPIEQLTLADLRETLKGWFSSFCTAVGIQALMTLMD